MLKQHLILAHAVGVDQSVSQNPSASSLYTPSHHPTFKNETNKRYISLASVLALEILRCSVWSPTLPLAP